MKRSVFFLLPLLAAALPAAAALPWMTDADAATAKAQESGQALLLDFTGSDWCRFCIKLHQEVLDTPSFEAYAQGKFVPLMLDFPRKSRQSAEESRRNAELRRRYAVQGFPTVLVLSPQGDVLGGFAGYRDAAKAQAALDKALQVQALLAEARALPAPQRLEKLCAAYRMIPADLRGCAAALNREIAELDHEGTSGLHSEEMIQRQREELRESLRAAAKPEEALERVNTLLETAYDENKAELYFVKESLLRYFADSVEDLDAARAEAEKGLALLDASMQEQIRPMLEKRYADKAALLEECRAQRREKK